MPTSPVMRTTCRIPCCAYARHVCSCCSTASRSTSSGGGKKGRGRGGGEAGRVDQGHRRQEAIAPAGDGGNEAIGICCIVQCLAQLANGHTYHRLTHDGLRPDRV